MIVEALKRLPFSVYSLKIERRSSKRVCSSREFVRVEARTIKSLASRMADSGVWFWFRGCFLGPWVEESEALFRLVPKAGTLG